MTEPGCSTYVVHEGCFNAGSCTGTLLVTGASTAAPTVTPTGPTSSPSLQPTLPTSQPSTSPSFNFLLTTGGKTGPQGPTYQQLVSSYFGSEVLNFGFTCTNGYQSFTAPNSGTYRFKVNGASGGSSGATPIAYGATIEATFSLLENDIITVVVGQKGSLNNDCFSSGGGGGSFVTKGSYASVVAKTDTLLIAAGGGGGSYSYGLNNGVAIGCGQSGTAASSVYAVGGTNGNGGGTSSNMVAVSGGGYFTNNGGSTATNFGGSPSSTISYGFREGSIGSNKGSACGYPTSGGFGGGGGGSISYQNSKGT